MGMCEGCHAGCCRSFAVPITGADIIRLERVTGKTFWDFGCRWADESGIIAANYAPHFHFEDEPETPFVICLKHVQSQNFPRTTKCMYLEESPPDAEHPLGIARCGNYAGRPAACRIFPTKFDVENELPVIHPVPEYGRSEKLPEYKLCPRQWTPQDLDVLESVNELVIGRYEARFFHQIAYLWNKFLGPWDIFPDFIRDVYAQRVQLMPEEIPSEILSETELNELQRHILQMPKQKPAQREVA